MLLALALAAAAETVVNRVELLTPGDPRYTALAVPAGMSTNPGASSRLVVVREGVPVLDRGLLAQRDASLADDPGVLEERGFVEDAVVAPDRSAAVVRQTRFTGRATVGTGSEPVTFRGRERLTWIDPDRPEGRWSVEFPEGRFVKELLVAPLASGAGAILTDAAGLGGELRLFDVSGKEILRLGPPGEEAVDVAAAADVPVVAIDVAYPAREKLPDRAIIVLDLTAGTRWERTWRYGDDDEPKSWSLEPDGSLVLQVPEGVIRIDRGGTTETPRGRGRGPFNRLRGSPS